MVPDMTSLLDPTFLPLTQPLTPASYLIWPCPTEFPVAFPALPVLFAEEPGLVLEVQEPHLAAVLQRYRGAGLQCLELGHTGEAGPHAMVRKPEGESGAQWAASGDSVGHLATQGKEPLCPCP